MSEFFSITDSCSEITANELQSAWSYKLIKAVRECSRFQLLGLYSHIDNQGTIDADTLIVDLIHTAVPSRNQIGILNRERLAIHSFIDVRQCPKVLALRKDFPLVIHLNSANPGKPCDLCIYELWSELRHATTPEIFLRDVSDWMLRSSLGDLHKEDQPVEPLFFPSPATLAFPFNLIEKYADPTDIYTISGFYLHEGRAFSRLSARDRFGSGEISVKHVLISLPVVTHGIVNREPKTLQELGEILARKGVDLVDELRRALQQIQIPSSGVMTNSNRSTLLVFSIPLRRNDNSQEELKMLHAFLLDQDWVKIASSLQVLWKINLAGAYYKQMGSSTNSYKELFENDAFWLDIKPTLTPTDARATSGSPEMISNLHGVIAGVGSLGSSLVLNLRRMGWGQWTLIDPDIVEPHNIARHIAVENSIGMHKVEAVKWYLEQVYSEPTVKTVSKSVLVEEPEVLKQIAESDLLIDATTSISVSRVISRQREVRRQCTVFLSPSGDTSVLMMEDMDRSIQVADIERQYYRAMLDETWGRTHYQTEPKISVGNSCRDETFIMPNSIVSIHAGILSDQIMRGCNERNPRLDLWRYDRNDGSVQNFGIALNGTISRTVGRWSIYWDEAIQEEVRNLREAKLPKETGGILLGYFDHVLEEISIVKACSAPIDSEENLNSFIRGSDNLIQAIELVQSRTANQVGYIGEWHSHPDRCSTIPSQDDIELLDYLACCQTKDGLPGLMMIVVESEIRFELSELAT